MAGIVRAEGVACIVVISVMRVVDKDPEVKTYVVVRRVVIHVTVTAIIIWTAVTEVTVAKLRAEIVVVIGKLIV